MLAVDEAVRLTEMADDWQPHPSRAPPPIAFMPGVEHVWDICRCCGQVETDTFLSHQVKFFIFIAAVPGQHLSS
jgi:hypothetical protein